MNDTIILSRLSITGPVDVSTPVIVIKEIADAHSIKYDETQLYNLIYFVKIINTINITKVKSIKKPYIMKDYKIIARFVNADVNWRKSSLIKAFDFLMSFTNIKKLKEYYVDFKCELQTPDNTKVLNACILYGICKINNIKTNTQSTMEEMEYNIKLYFLLEKNKNKNLKNLKNHGKNINKQSSYKQKIINMLTDAIENDLCYNDQLINMLSILGPNHSKNIFLNKYKIEKPAIITYKDLQDAGEHIRHNNIKIPKTHAEAVVLSAMQYKTDITNTDYPLTEYENLKNKVLYFEDDRLHDRLKISQEHPMAFENPNLTKVFNPNLPYILYEDGDLMDMCIYEGYTEDDIYNEGSYTLLQTAYFYPTFYHGKQNNTDITNSENTMLDELDDLEYDDVVIYGIKGSEFVFYSYGELADTFRNYSRFQNPLGKNEIFTDVSMNKLYNMIERMVGLDVISDDIISLKNEIEHVRIYKETNNKTIINFITRYNGLDNNDKVVVDDFMMLLVHSAMYMRGWSGKGPYPLDSSDAIVRSVEQAGVDLLVTQSIQDIDQELLNLNKNLNSLGGFGDLIKSLPLIFYNNTSEELLLSTDIEEGLTIYDRLNIVKGGVSGSFQSCIRMSSNRFAASAYYYMKLMRLPLPFDISRMSHIM